MNFISRQNSYARNVLTLMMGTGLAQAIPIAVSPILTRIYTPEDFGVFALYISIVSILSIFVTGRYELAILLPKNKRDGFHIVALSILLTCLLSLTCIILIIIFNNHIYSLWGDKAILKWIYWIPISTFLTGIISNLNYWNSRKELYNKLAISRVTQSTTGATSQLCMPLLVSGPLGLIVGQLIGQIFSIIYLIKNTYIEEKSEFKKLQWRRIFVLSYKYKDFPKLMIIAHSFNAASIQMPVILLGILFNTTTAGYYMLIQRIMGVPMALVSNAFGDVFRQEAVKAYKETGTCRIIYEKTLKRLSLIAVFPFAMFFFIAPDFIRFIFGEEWSLAGKYAQILTPMFFLQFITSPLSSMFMIAEKQKIDLIWQVSLFLLVIAGLIIGAYTKSVSISLIIFSASYCAMYIINAIIAYRLTIKI